MPFGQIIKRTNPENFKELQERASEFDKFLLEEIGLDRQGRISTGDTDRSAYRTGSLVTNVPNAPQEPEKRINKMTGMPYDIEAGPNAQPEKTRVGLSEEGKFLGALQRRRNAYYGGRLTMSSGGGLNLIDIIKENIREEEGLRLEAYKPVPTEKYYTIAYGHYGADVAKDMKITEKEAEEFLDKDVKVRLKQINKMLPNFNKFPIDVQVPIFSEFYRGSIGGSKNTRRLINEGKYKEAAVEFLDNDEYRNAEKLGKPGIKRRMEKVSEALNRLAKQNDTI